jgi:uracil-DNA glycosylase family 4
MNECVPKSDFRSKSDFLVSNRNRESRKKDNRNRPVTKSAAGLHDAERAAKLKALEAEVAVCELCPLAATRTHAVPGEGNLASVVMFVGEGPGFEEDRQGRPFVGRSGQYLTETLSKAGIRRQDVYITNVVKCRPPNNRDPEIQELAACDDFLVRQIEIINPRIIVTLGRFSMRRWFKDGAITKIHGKITNIGRGRVAMAMFHPAAALRNPQWRVEFERDMQLLPPLIARAERANAAVARGEALPAGVPHPGDPDYVAPPPADDDGDDTQLSLFAS